jgi:hypothetical protein
MHKRQQRTGVGTLALECEAFLHGTLAEFWDERGVMVPVWAWTNLLAHGSESMIAGSTARPPKPRRINRSWRIARSYLAHQLLGLSGTQGTLAGLQSSILIPLELEMADRPEVDRWTPRQWVDTVDHALRGQHSTTER